MKTHHVEVDGEVFEFVKNQAEPLVDSFNSVIRRLLGLDKVEKYKIERNELIDSQAHEIPHGTPRALAQILEVVELVIRNNLSRVEATHQVARRRNVEPQTVNDKFGRQLGLTAELFDQMLGQQGLVELKRTLIEKFPLHQEIIEKVLS